MFTSLVLEVFLPWKYSTLEILEIFAKLQKIRASELGDAVIVNIDNNQIFSDYEDLEELPSEVVSTRLQIRPDTQKQRKPVG